MLNEARSTALLTDLYQLSMAAGYQHHGLAGRRACFHWFFRRAPFGGSHAIAAGLDDVLDFIERYRFESDDLAYLRELEDPTGAPLFSREQLSAFAELKLDLDIDAVPEGTVVFPHAPLARVEGSLVACQLVESGLLAIGNFQTLVATKASRMKRAARGAPIVDFGLRRAQGLDGALSATRAAYIGGVDATSNVAAGRRFGIGVRGTHAHAWVMAFGDETRAFEAYAEVMPGASTFLVDTYDTREGIARAIRVGLAMRAEGRALRGIRLDSGDLGALAVEAREMLDAAGLVDVKIVASNDLDEHAIGELVARGAPIDVWGVGTRLVTAWGEPALGGVYKLAAIESADGVMEPRVKVSSERDKTTLPGQLGVRRHLRAGVPVADVIHPLAAGVTEPHEAVELLVPVMRRGKRVSPRAPLAEARDRAMRELAALPESITRLVDPEPYSVRLDPELEALRARLVRAAGGS